MANCPQDRSPSLVNEQLTCSSTSVTSDMKDINFKKDSDFGDTSLEESISNNDNSVNLNSARDSYWGWVIVFASFMCNVIVDGIIFCFGVIMLEISKDFKQPKGTTAWIGSLQAGFYLFVGPLVSTLANHYGCRVVTIIGSLIASLGFIISYFATSVLWLCLSYGALAGIGLGFIYLPAIVMVGHYFERRRAFATGIAVCGSGVGAFLMAPIIQYLNDTYHWRGCVLILAGIVLNCAVFGFLFRPLPSDETSSSSGDQESDGSGKPLLGHSKKSWLLDDSDEEGVDLMESSRQATDYSSQDQQQKDPQSHRYKKNRRYTFSEGSSVVHKSIDDKTNHPHRNRYVRTPIPHRHNYQHLPSHHQHHRPRAHSFGINYVFQNEILYSTLSLQEFKASVKRPLAASFTREQQTLPSSSQHRRQSVIEEATSCVKLLDLSLLLSPSFLLLGISGFLTLSGFFIPFMYIVDRSIQIGTTPEKGALLLSIIGITNTVGRVFCGWISDSPKVRPLIINNIALVIGGLVTALSPLICNTFTSLIVYCSLFGFSIACFVALRSVITVELLGLERLTSAFGLLLLPQGIATIIGGPIAGWFFDITNSYNASFYLAGSVITISGIMCFPLGLISKWEKSRSQLTPVSQC
ncbi:monocarboxylate transporter 12-like [Tetranychus urticae]|uniref:monocarboxylate transporter 12-like n=1 Tax=Tetranychus urticae TaxID=32264 RepID=UPI000D6487D1|nr:monocarboxylate transporter 12-like [Tetranychus urticae]